MRHFTLLLYAVGGLLVLLLEGIALASWQGWLPRRHAHAPQALPAVPLPRQETVAALPLSKEIEAPSPERAIDAHYRELRARLRWVPARIGGREFLTMDLPSRVLLAKSAARQARLHEVGLGFEDVYGIINAESSWTPRDGVSRDGKTPNLGIAQFEPATAAALGVRDPHDAVEAVHAAARHMREAAEWSASRIAGLRLGKKERAARLREGVSIYYNLSSRGRELWNGRDASRLPLATHIHIRNARLGAREAAEFEARWRAMEAAGRDEQGDTVLTATAQPAPNP